MEGTENDCVPHGKDQQMSQMDIESLKAWAALLPTDFASAVGTPDPSSSAHLSFVGQRLQTLSTSEQVLKFVEAHPDAFIGMGRPGRIRFLAWFQGKGHEDSPVVIDRITEGDGDAGSGAGKVAPYFKQDLEAIATVLGKRMAREMVDSYTLEVIAGASLEAASLDMRGGGL